MESQCLPLCMPLRRTPESLIEPADCHTAHFAHPVAAAINGGDHRTRRTRRGQCAAVRRLRAAPRRPHRSPRAGSTGVEFFGTAGFSALHSVNVRCAGEKIEWAMGAQPGRHPAAADLRSRFGLAYLHQRRQPQCRPCGASRVGYCNSSRRRARDFANNRETCICGDANPLGDLRLRQGLEEPQQQHGPLPLRQHSEQGPQRFPVLDLIRLSSTSPSVSAIAGASSLPLPPLSIDSVL